LLRLFHFLLVLTISLSLKGAISFIEAAQNHKQDESIKIGLLIPDRSSQGIIRAAKMAIEEANALGGFNSVPFELVVRTTEGPWGAGSKESVALVYEDHVLAIMGSLDGRNAHLAEQVATKSHITYLETRATEPTLSQAFVPWFFRCVPNDDQQSRAILEYINKNGAGPVAILYGENYDSRMAAKSFTRISARMGINPPELLTIKSEEIASSMIADRLKNKKIRHLIITSHTGISLEIIREARKMIPSLMVYGTHTFSSGMNLDHPNRASYEKIVLISRGSLHHAPGEQFRSAFKSRFGKLPGIAESYAYDGMNLIIEAIRKAGLDREAIKDTIADIHHSKGVTGSIEFDEFGNRTDPVRFMIVQHDK